MWYRPTVDRIRSALVDELRMDNYKTDTHGKYLEVGSCSFWANEPRILGDVHEHLNVTEDEINSVVYSITSFGGVTIHHDPLYLHTNAEIYAYRFFIRDNAVNAQVLLTKNDIDDYRIIRMWCYQIMDKAAEKLNIEVGQVFWHTDSFRIYEPHFYLLDHYKQTLNFNVTPKEYNKLNPDSRWHPGS